MRIVRWITWLVMIVTYFFAIGVLEEVPGFEDGLVRYVFCTVVMFFVVLVHELGHAIVARQVGAEVRSIMVWPFEVTLRPRKLGMAKAHRNGDIGGYVAFRLDRMAALSKHMLIAFAGPVANLVSAMAVTMIAWFAVPAAFTTPSHDILPALANAFATLLAGVSLANLLPFDGSDGMVLLRGLRHWNRDSRR